MSARQTERLVIHAEMWQHVLVYYHTYATCACTCTVYKRAMCVQNTFVIHTNEPINSTKKWIYTVRLNYKQSLLLLIGYKFNRRYCHYYSNYYKNKTQTYQLHVSRIYLKWQRRLQSYVLKETPYSMPYIISLRTNRVNNASIVRLHGIFFWNNNNLILVQHVVDCFVNTLFINQISEASSFDVRWLKLAGGQMVSCCPGSTGVWYTSLSTRSDTLKTRLTKTLPHASIQSK